VGQTLRRVTSRLTGRAVVVPLLAAVAGLATAGAAFLPWYAMSIYRLSVTTTSTGWQATSLARGLVVLGVLAAAGAVLLALDAAGAARLDVGLAESLRWIVAGAMALSVLLVAYRMVVLPDSDLFLERQAGIHAALLTSLGGLAAGLAMAPPPHRRVRAGARTAR
jgi:hypothetical protein